MLRKSLGLFMIVHGLAHTLAGMRVSDATQLGSAGADILVSVATAAWAAAAVGFVGAGLGLLGVPVFRSRWPVLALTGAVGSLVLVGLWRSWLAPPGLLITAALLVIVLHAMRFEHRARTVAGPSAPSSAPHESAVEVGR